MRREWGSVTEKHGQPYLVFTRADGTRTMRRLRRPKRERGDEIESIRLEVENERAGVVAVEPMRFRDFVRTVYGPVMASRVQPGTLRSAEIHLGRFAAWIESAGDPTIDRVTRADVENFIAALSKEGLMNSYIARLLRTVRTAWKSAVERRIATENPFVGAKTGKIKKTEIVWMTPADFGRVCAAANENQRPLLTLIGETGLCIGETLALRWRDVSLEGDDPHVHVCVGKTDARRRDVPLVPYAVALLRTIRGAAEDGDRVFSARTSQGVRAALAAACTKAKLPKLTTHQIRHVVGAHLMQCGTPPTTVAAILGHNDRGVLAMQLYGRGMAKDATRSAMVKMQAFRAPTPDVRPATPETPRG